MSRITPRCSQLLLLISALAPVMLCFAEPVIGSAGPQLDIDLPSHSMPNGFYWLESSEDMIRWEPVARNYGYAWENTFPRQVAISGSPGDQVFSGIIGDRDQYYRILQAPANELNNREAASRFLQQATFGPTRQLIENFPGISSATGFNDAPYPYFAQWIDEQIDIPLFSLRAFFRERSNPAFVSNVSASSPYEVGHNPALGHQLTYYIGGIRYNPKGTDATAVGRNANDVSFPAAYTKQIPWYQAAITAPDALRQRVAWALSQLFVVGEEGSNQTVLSERYLSYYDIFIRRAFGNFRDILEEVTYHPAMGYYLTHMDNKAYHVENTYPDENYAREIMQLFTIGLWELNPDGSLKLGENGEPIPTYDNSNIEEFAKIFTGMRRKAFRENIESVGSSNYIDSMRIQINWHDFTEKSLLDGSVIGPFEYNQAAAKAEVSTLLDHLFNHANTGPFVSRFLIQRLTSSNPSPSYIEAVSTAFNTGFHNGSGTGERGDMEAVIKAILLHPEARSSTLALDDTNGKLREPIIRLLHVARAFAITSTQTYGFFPFYDLEELLSQAPFQYPSVFNFYQKEFQPIGPILDRDIYAPEFEIHTDLTSIGLANAIHTLIYEGIANEIGLRGYSQAQLDLTYEIGLAFNAESLIDHLDIMLTAGRLTDANRESISSVINAMPATTNNLRKARVQKALYLFSLLPEFNVIY